VICRGLDTCLTSLAERRRYLARDRVEHNLTRKSHGAGDITPHTCHTLRFTTVAGGNSRSVGCTDRRLCLAGQPASTHPNFQAGLSSLTTYAWPCGELV